MIYVTLTGVISTVAKLNWSGSFSKKAYLISLIDIYTLRSDSQLPWFDSEALMLRD